MWIVWEELWDRPSMEKVPKETRKCFTMWGRQIWSRDGKEGLCGEEDSRTSAGELQEVNGSLCKREKSTDLVSFIIEAPLKSTVPGRVSCIYWAPIMGQALCYVLGIQCSKRTYTLCLCGTNHEAGERQPVTKTFSYKWWKNHEDAAEAPEIPTTFLPPPPPHQYPRHTEAGLGSHRGGPREDAKRTWFVAWFSQTCLCPLSKSIFSTSSSYPSKWV